MVVNKENNAGGGSGGGLSGKNNESHASHNVVQKDFLDVKKEVEDSLKIDNNKLKADNNQFAIEQQDAAQIERNNVGIIGNLALSNINHDIEDLQPNVGSIQMSSKATQLQDIVNKMKQGDAQGAIIDA